MKKHNQFQSLLILIAVAMFVSCGPCAKEIAAIEKAKAKTIINLDSIVAAVKEIKDGPEETIRPIKTWNGKDLDLPAGVVTGGSWYPETPSESYLELRLSDGTYTIVKGISEAAYTAVEKNDIIK